MKTHKELEDYILSLDDARLDFPFGESTSVYRLNEEGDDKMFALIDNNARPIRLSLKCDPLLAEKLRQDYETVLPGYHLNKKHWNTIICTGQVPDDELRSLILISYNLAKGVKF
jgi:predicted DNA-binding protein (MmcQ/YjbR family)